MSSSQSLREFIRERLTAAAEEIFTEFDKTIVHYEEELDRQRRLLEISLKPQINLQRIVLPQHYVWKEEEVPTDHHFSNLESNSSLDQEESHPFCTKEELGKPEPQQKKESRAKLETPQIMEDQVDPEHPAIKTEQEELYISLEKEQVEQQQSINSFTLVTVCEETDHRELESYKDQLIAQLSNMSEEQNQQRSDLEDSGSSSNEENKSFQQIQGDVEDVDNTEVERQETVHINDSISACKICGKSFSKRYLTEHMRIHRGDKPFSCVTCGKKFSYKAGLRQHTRTHTGEKPFCCATCGTRFYRRSSLADHKKTHSGEKPFSCLTCGKTFSLKRSLSRHIRNHTGEKPFSCLTCGRRFSDRPSLSRHIKIHTGEKPFSCLTCGKRFNRKSNLTNHMKTYRCKQVKSDTLKCGGISIMPDGKLSIVDNH
ncbi:zinc finger protein 69 homolog [Fundulus heteroclitus]|uniref:zinc finger protein 69 homolog n=1 Tax=Fundulus heteroclitus TaxID=8078 RepID=UPI00165BCA45|nr:zinc finger protein 69 homolog [Fundulus heteroclitus]